MGTNGIYNVYESACPAHVTLGHISDKWTVLVMGLLEGGPKRFSALKREIGGISQKMLTQTLRRLERDGFISRTIYPEVPPHVEYDLTVLGHSLSAPISAVRQWTEKHIEEIRTAQQIYDERPQRRGSSA